MEVPNLWVLYVLTDPNKFHKYPAVPWAQTINQNVPNWPARYYAKTMLMWTIHNKDKAKSWCDQMHCVSKVPLL
jgi:hypothetical protein